LDKATYQFTLIEDNPLYGIGLFGIHKKVSSELISFIRNRKQYTSSIVLGSSISNIVFEPQRFDGSYAKAKQGQNQLVHNAFSI